MTEQVKKPAVSESDLNQLLVMLSEAPDGQICKTITPEIKRLIGKPFDEIELGMKTILDKCAYFALASEFGMLAMDKAWRMSKAH